MPIPKDTLHKEIHHSILEVPLPSEIVCEDTYNQLVMLEKRGALKDDNIIQRLDLLIFMMDCVAEDTVRVLKEQKDIALRYYKKDG